MESNFKILVSGRILWRREEDGRKWGEWALVRMKRKLKRLPVAMDLFTVHGSSCRCRRKKCFQLSDQEGRTLEESMKYIYFTIRTCWKGERGINCDCNACHIKNWNENNKYFKYVPFKSLKWLEGIHGYGNIYKSWFRFRWFSWKKCQMEGSFQGGRIAFEMKEV